MPIVRYFRTFWRAGSREDVALWRYHAIFDNGTIRTLEVRQHPEGYLWTIPGQDLQDQSTLCPSHAAAVDRALQYLIDQERRERSPH